MVAAMLLFSSSHIFSTVLVLAGYWTPLWAQLASPGWRKPNITTAVADRIGTVNAAVQKTIDHIGTDGQFSDADYLIPAIFYSQLAGFDVATSSNQHHDLLARYFNLAQTASSNFANLNVSVSFFDSALADGQAPLASLYVTTAVSDPSIAGLSTGHFAILSALLAASTSKPDYLSAAQLSITFMQSHWLNPQNIILDGISGRSNDSCSLSTSPQPYDSGMAIEVLAILVDITKDSAYQRLLTSLVEAAILSPAWQGANGIISNQAHGSGGDLFVVRGLSAAYSRNATSSSLKEYIKAYLAVQYNGVLDLARSSGSDTYGHWIGPAATTFNSIDQTSALGVLVAAIGLHNETVQTTSSSGGGPTSSAPPSSSNTTLASAAPHPKSHTGAVVGGIVAAVVVTLICVGLLFWIRRRRQNSRRELTGPALDIPSVRPSINPPSTTTISPFTSPVSQSSSSALTAATPHARYGQREKHHQPGPSTSRSLSDGSRTDFAFIAEQAEPVPASITASALPTDELVRILHSRLQGQNAEIYDNDAPPPRYPGTDAGTSI
ncbi:Glycoside hydrolase family 76 protein [Mycena indigotica]|uniref:Glycoside hydrolase family 76 protein n=1 Tax=Mycena indigotica TaxID=2126181 RepID=A0A8H6TCK0_9AGAR|nr:Glycoside hydrolase family 76 protein [Mycena indigotica]KAF7316078.1 Glycoside hydrolase family 76 protein [Mycena indigotica]